MILQLSVVRENFMLETPITHAKNTGKYMSNSFSLLYIYRYLKHGTIVQDYKLVHLFHHASCILNSILINSRKYKKNKLNINTLNKSINMKNYKNKRVGGNCVKAWNRFRI